MKPTYILKEVHIRSENREKDGVGCVIREGDIILDKGFRFEVLPAVRDVTKQITRKKLTNTPLKKSERLLRIKELGEASAVIAILRQETYFEGADILVTKETERLVTVKYGEEFSVYAKEQFQGYGLPSATAYAFMIAEESKRQERNAQNFCTECGTKLIKGDKFCRECGTPVFR